MSVHFRSDCGDATLHIDEDRSFRRGPRLRVTLPGGRFRTFSLTERERAMLIAELTAKPVAMPAPVCFHGDHVPGCDHQALEPRARAAALLGEGE